MSAELVCTFAHYSISQRTFHGLLPFLSLLIAHRAIVVRNLSRYLTELPSATYFIQNSASCMTVLLTIVFPPHPPLTSFLFPLFISLFRPHIFTCTGALSYDV